MKCFVAIAQAQRSDRNERVKLGDFRRLASSVWSELGVCCDIVLLHKRKLFTKMGISLPVFGLSSMDPKHSVKLDPHERCDVPASRSHGSDSTTTTWVQSFHNFSHVWSHLQYGTPLRILGSSRSSNPASSEACRSSFCVSCKQSYGGFPFWCHSSGPELIHTPVPGLRQ